MGDHNSVDVVQGLHVDMLTTGGATPVDGCMEYGLPLPLSNTYFGVYIDDVIVAQVLIDSLLRTRDQMFLSRNVLAPSMKSMRSKFL